MKISIKTISLSAVMTALLCIIAPITIPTGAVPVSAITFIIILSSVILGAKPGTLSVLTYIILGLVGLPVFSGFSGGLAILAGPTGGYITGYIFLAAISGTFAEYFHENKVIQIIGSLIGNAVMYIFGAIWFALQTKTDFAHALAVGVIPFIGWDIVKTILAVLIGNLLKKRLKKSGILK